MTVAAEASPIVASLVPPAVAGATPPGPPGAALPAAASEATGPTAPAFSSLLMGLQATASRGVTTGAATATPTVVADPDALPIDPAGCLPGAEVATEDPLSPPSLPFDAAPGGDELPDTGQELPPDVTALLASLAAGAPASASPPPAAPPPSTGSAAAPDATAGATTTPAAPAAAAAAELLVQPADADRPVDPSMASFATDARDAATATKDTDSDASATSRDPLSRDASAVATRERAAEIVLPAEFRARIDALLNPTQRPVSMTDGIALPIQPQAIHAGTQSTAVTSAALPQLDALPVLHPAGDADAFAQGLGDRLMMMAEKGLQSATIRLQPENLGPMEIRVRVDEDGGANVLFSAHHAQTRDALESSIPRLRDMLAEQGLSLSQANVDAGRGSFGQRGFAGELPAWASRWTAPAADPSPAVEVSAWRIGRSSEHRLDVLV